MASTFGAIVALTPARAIAVAQMAGSDSAANRARAAAAPPTAPIWSARRRPMVVSARWPHIGLRITRATAIPAITPPISPAVRPLLSRNIDRKGKYAAMTTPNRMNSVWTATAGRIRGALAAGIEQP